MINLKTSFSPRRTQRYSEKTKVLCVAHSAPAGDRDRFDAELLTVGFFLRFPVFLGVLCGVTAFSRIKAVMALAVLASTLRKTLFFRGDKHLYLGCLKTP
jgi:hypothetical protein